MSFQQFKRRQGGHLGRYYTIDIRLDWQDIDCHHTPTVNNEPQPPLETLPLGALPMKTYADGHTVKRERTGGRHTILHFTRLKCQLGITPATKLNRAADGHDSIITRRECHASLPAYIIVFKRERYALSRHDTDAYLRLSFELRVLPHRRITAHSRIGRAMIAVREDEVAAQSNGINVTKYKISSFVLGAAMGGIAGCMQTAYTLTVQPGSYTFMVSVMVLCTVVLGGMGNGKAVILGAFIIQFISYLPQLTGLTNVIPAQAKQMIYGLLLVVMMLWRPQGILGRDRFRYGDPRTRREKIAAFFRREGRNAEGGAV